MRELRKATGKKLREIAAGMKVSVTYVSDLETGRRNWTRDLGERFRKAALGK